MSARRVGRRERTYPGLLAAIYDPPPQLWIRGDGDLAVLERPCLALVGARSCSSYGRAVARSLARDAAAAGAVVVSGLARGVDGEAHRGALEAGGVTVAVLGCGIDRDYPAAHRELARSIVESGGLVLSEYEPGVEPAPWRFPARNRIIAGLSHVTVVIEARQRSGALITADFALEQGREVMAVPGEITSALSAGANGLLRQGAAPVTRSLDVLEALGLEEPVALVAPPESEIARAILTALAERVATADELVRTTGRDVGSVTAALVELELGGQVSVAEGEYRSTISR